MMSNNKAAVRWIVNLVSFILFLTLTVTGLINWLLIPGGPRGDGGFLMSFRHFLRGIHEWAGLFFILAVVVHLFLHWTYIKANLRKQGPKS